MDTHKLNAPPSCVFLVKLLKCQEHSVKKGWRNVGWSSQEPQVLKPTDQKAHRDAIPASGGWVSRTDMMGLEQATILTAHSCQCKGGGGQSPRIYHLLQSFSSVKISEQGCRRQSGWTLKMPVIAELNVRCQWKESIPGRKETNVFGRRGAVASS